MRVTPATLAVTIDICADATIGYLPARHIAADRIHRDVPVAEHDAGQRLDLEVAQRLLLLLREIAHLRLGEFDVVEVALLHLADGALGSSARSNLKSRAAPSSNFC